MPYSGKLPVEMPSLREYATLCRKMALTARHPVLQEHLLRMAAEMDQQAGIFEREDAALTDREAG